MNNPEHSEKNEKGFHYFVTDEQIKEHQKKSVKEIFEWLQSANDFIQALQTPEEQIRMNKIRKGEL
jgi:hypothetical protein